MIEDIIEHDVIKPILLDCIEKHDSFHMDGPGEKISKTDWNKNNGQYYGELFKKTITPYLEKLGKSICCEKPIIHDYWFQQYYKGDIHDWHIHGYCQYICVYFLELTDTKEKTEFLNGRTGQLVENINVKEGQFLVFPSNYIHRSPIINSNFRKTVIAFNISFDIVDNFNPALTNKR